MDRESNSAYCREGAEETKPLIEDTIKSLESSDIEPPSRERTVSKGRQWSLFVTLMLLQFLTLSIDTFLLPFFTEKAFAKNLTELQVGVIFSGYNFSRFIGATFLVQWTLLYSYRKVYMIGGLISSICCILFGLSALAPDGLWFFCLCAFIRLVAGLTSGLLTTVTTTTLLKNTDFTPSVIMACVEALVGAGFAAGPAIGSILYKYMGYTGAFMPLGGFTLLATIITALVLPGNETAEADKESSEDRDQKSSCGGLLRIIRIPGLALIIASMIALKMASYGGIVFLSHFLLSQFGMDISTVGAVFLGNAICYSVFSLLSAKLVDWFGLLWTQMVAGWLVMVVTFFMLPPSPLLHFVLHGYSGTVLLNVYIQGIGEAGIYVAPLQIGLSIISSYGYREDDKKTYSMVSGLIHGSTSLGAGLAPILSGAVNQYLDFDWYSTAAGLASSFMLFLTFLYLLMSNCAQVTKRFRSPTKEEKN